MNPIEMVQYETGLVPKDITGAAQDTDWVSLKNDSWVRIIIQQGAWAGGTPAVTLNQATDVSGTGSKSLGFSKRWTKTGLTGTTSTETAVTSDTFNLSATANTINEIFIKAADLDVDNGFDCLSVHVATPGSNADLLCIGFLLG